MMMTMTMTNVNHTYDSLVVLVDAIEEQNRYNSFPSLTTAVLFSSVDQSQDTTRPDESADEKCLSNDLFGNYILDRFVCKQKLIV